MEVARATVYTYHAIIYAIPGNLPRSTGSGAQVRKEVSSERYHTAT